jgi:predicted nucleic acid-binding protein
LEHIVVDSNILVAALLEAEVFHSRSLGYINGLESGDYIFHLPMLVGVEVVAAIGRRTQRNRQALLAGWKQNIADWQRDGKISFYPLDRQRMDNATEISELHRLRGSDSVVVALAEELDLPLKTFDIEILARYLKSSA